MSTWWSYFYPQKLFEASTPYNRHIRVNDEFGSMKLLVNGSPQSGRYIKHLWKQAFHYFPKPAVSYKDILVLGVGGGTAISLLSKAYPNAHITAVDIDPVMIHIAKTYFHLDACSHISFVTRDAKEYVRTVKSRFDCCVIDLFSGRDIPSFVSSREFLSEVKDKLRKENGVVYINYLKEREYQEKSDTLYKVLKSLFVVVKDYSIVRNRFFFASIV